MPPCCVSNPLFKRNIRSAIYSLNKKSISVIIEKSIVGQVGNAALDNASNKTARLIIVTT